MCKDDVIVLCQYYPEGWRNGGYMCIRGNTGNEVYLAAIHLQRLLTLILDLEYVGVDFQISGYLCKLH